MRSFEALQAAINGKTVDHAKRLGLATVTVNKWQEPSLDFSDSGVFNPLDRIETIVEGSLAHGNPPERAYAPIHYLAEKFGLVVIPLPVAMGSASEATRELNKTIKEFGELVTIASDRLGDGDVSKLDAKEIGKEAQELIRQVAAFNAKIQEACKPKR